MEIKEEKTETVKRWIEIRKGDRSAGVLPISVIFQNNSIVLYKSSMNTKSGYSFEVPAEMISEYIEALSLAKDFYNNPK